MKALEDALDDKSQAMATAMRRLTSAVDGRFLELTAELNTFAQKLDQSTGLMESTMRSHLGKIEGTFQQCEGTLGNMQALRRSSPAAPPQAAAVPFVFTQDLLAVRRSIDEGNKKLIEAKERLERLEDMQIHDTIAATNEQAWARDK